MRQDDTIVALATAAGRSGVAVIRLSGKEANRALQALGVRRLPEPRKAKLSALLHPVSGELLDYGIVLRFPAPHSFTGEEVVELQVHGSMAVTQALLQALTGIEGIRLAEPGEFSRRAFRHGKMDLTQAEGLADLIDAESEGQRRQALRIMGGEAEEIYEQLRQDIIRISAQLEALIDFPDEDLPHGIRERIEIQVNTLIDTMTHMLASAHRAMRMREGITVAIIGVPNAGKSSLLNMLTQKDSAIVSPIAGTTRDAVQVTLHIDGFVVTLVDTAGIRESEDSIELEGIRRAKYHAKTADLALVVLDATRSLDEQQHIRAMTDHSIFLWNKIDLADDVSRETIRSTSYPVFSLVENKGRDDLVKLLTRHIHSQYLTDAAPVITRQRHHQLVEAALTHLKRVDLYEPWEIAAEELRQAILAIGKITGSIHHENVLDTLFKEFCIGK